MALYEECKGPLKWEYTQWIYSNTAHIFPRPLPSQPPQTGVHILSGGTDCLPGTETPSFDFFSTQQHIWHFYLGT